MKSEVLAIAVGISCFSNWGLNSNAIAVGTSAIATTLVLAIAWCDGPQPGRQRKTEPRRSLQWTATHTNAP